MAPAPADVFFLARSRTRGTYSAAESPPECWALPLVLGDDEEHASADESRSAGDAARPAKEADAACTTLPNCKKERREE